MILFKFGMTRDDNQKIEGFDAIKMHIIRYTLRELFPANGLFGRL